MFRRNNMAREKNLKKKTQTVITPRYPKNIERRELLAQAARVVAGTVGGFALISMAKIDTVFGQNEATQKSIRRKVQKTLLKTFKERDVATQVLASQQTVADAKACDCFECSVVCNCPCTCPSETSYTVHTSNLNPAFQENVHAAVDKAVAGYQAKLPAVTGVGLGMMAVGLGVAGAWRALKERAALKDKT
jgi:hypothetical protein